MSVTYSSQRRSRVKPRTRFAAALMSGVGLYALASGAALAQMSELPLDEMIDLGTLGGNYSYAAAVSADGAVVVGEAYLPSGYYHAAMWSDGDIVDLGTLGGTYSYARGVSADGLTIIGHSEIAEDSNYHAFSYRGGVMNDLGTLGGDYSYAYAVNGDGSVIVGHAELAGGHQRAARWVNGMISNLGTLGGDYSYARDVSLDGTVVSGYSNVTGDSTSHAFRWTQAGGMVDLGTLGGSHSYARDLSSDGTTVTGGAYLAGDSQYHAFRWRQASGMVDLGTLGGTYSYGEALSADGSVVVGYSHLGGEDNVYHAFRWTEAGGMDDLGTLGGDYSYGEDVSADGSVVVGYSRIGGEENTYHAFLWNEEEGMVDLGTLGGNYSYASAISDDGSTIVGWSYINPDDSVSHAFIYRTEMQDFANMISSFGQLAIEVDAAAEEQRSAVNWLLSGACRIENGGEACYSAAGRVNSTSADNGLSLPDRDGRALRFSAGRRISSQTTFGGGMSFFGPNDPLGAVDVDDGYAFGGWVNWSRDGMRTGHQANIAIAHGSQSVTTSRGLGFANVQVLNGETDLDTTTIQARWGYGIASANNTVLTPHIAVTRQQTTLGAFQEEPGDFPATFTETQFDTTYGSVGVDMEAPVGGHGQLRATAAIDLDMNNDPVVLEGTSAIPGMNPFSMPSVLVREENRLRIDAQYVRPTGPGLLSLGVSLNKAAVGGPTAVGFSIGFGADF